MKTHYYLDWFYDKGFAEKLANVLHEDIVDRKSLVMISADYKYAHENVDELSERLWFDKADIIFDEYNLIDNLTKKEDAQRIIRDASVIFLCGGNPWDQKQLLTEYELSSLIKKSDAVVMGTSAGAMNMSDKWIDSNSCTIYDGMALNHFSFEAHFDLARTEQIECFYPLSEMMVIYVADKDGAVRVKGGKIDIIGSVHLISHSKIQRLVETL